MLIITRLYEISSTLHRRARICASSCGDSDDIDDNCNSALLKRIKSENKELRKSRNALRKDHGLLKKIEGKLRHKLEIIACKFNMIIAINNDDRYDDMNWPKLQKKGDIETILDAVFTLFGNKTDKYVDFETKWSEDCDQLTK
eukprot:286147_1